MLSFTLGKETTPNEMESYLRDYTNRTIEEHQIEIALCKTKIEHHEKEIARLRFRQF